MGEKFRGGKKLVRAKQTLKKENFGATTRKKKTYWGKIILYKYGLGRGDRGTWCEYWAEGNFFVRKGKFT